MLQNMTGVNEPASDQVRLTLQVNYSASLTVLCSRDTNNQKLRPHAYLTPSYAEHKIANSIVPSDARGFADATKHNEDSETRCKTISLRCKHEIDCGQRSPMISTRMPDRFQKRRCQATQLRAAGEGRTI